MRTIIDEQKESADILIECRNGRRYIIKIQNKNIEIKGRGIKSIYGNGFIEVTENFLKKLQLKYNVMPNF